MEWIQFGENEYGTPTSEDGTSYIVHKGAGQERWEVLQHLGWPKPRKFLEPPPPGARTVTRYASTLEEGQELAERIERDRTH